MSALWLVVVAALSMTQSSHVETNTDTAPFQCTSADYCNARCPNNQTQTQMAGATFSLIGTTLGKIELHTSVVRMIKNVSDVYGNVTNTVENDLHLSFLYLCCYNRTELEVISRAIATVKWRAVPVRFTRVVCAASMAIALADPVAQGALFGVVSAIENAIADAGLPVHRFRAEQAPFHASLFNAQAPKATNIQDVIELAQSTVSSGLNSNPIIVDSFDFNGETFRALPN